VNDSFIFVVALSVAMSEYYLVQILKFSFVIDMIMYDPETYFHQRYSFPYIVLRIANDINHCLHKPSASLDIPALLEEKT
jgi:hypothetical protein